MLSVICIYVRMGGDILVGRGRKGLEGFFNYGLNFSWFMKDGKYWGGKEARREDGE